MGGIEPTVAIALIAFGGVVMTAVGTLLGVLVTRGTETRKLIAGASPGYSQLVEDLQEERTALKADLVAVLAEQASMRTRMRGLEAGQDNDRKLIEILREHIRDLRSYIRAAGVPVPPAPAGSGVEDSGEHHPVTTTTTTVTTQ